MKNYIVRNCPAYLKYNKCLHNGHCDYITDCVLKRIVDECDSNVSKVLYEGKTLKFVEGNPLAKKILEMLEIEEVDDTN